MSSNTGVMLFSASNFGLHVKNILNFGSRHSFDFPAFDQGLMNAYFDQKEYFHLRTVLPLQWNYKVYWGQPSKSDVSLLPQIIHFHGPKPQGRGLDCLASMNPKSAICEQYGTSNSSIAAYQPLIQLGFNADGGLLANQILDQYNKHVSS